MPVGIGRESYENLDHSVMYLPCVSVRVCVVQGDQQMAGSQSTKGEIVNYVWQRTVWRGTGWRLHLFLLACFASLFLGTAGIAGAASHEAPVLISEVLYDAAGPDQDEEWVELFNRSDSPVGLSGFKLGDAAVPGAGEGMYQFPAGLIEPGQTIVVAQKASVFLAIYGTSPDFEINDTVPEVPDLVKYTDWASGSLALANSGDEIVLLDGIDNYVDVVAYESGSFAGVVPHPGVSTGHSIERSPRFADTDDCSVDFVDQADPRPDPPGGDPTSFFNFSPPEGSAVNDLRPLIGAEYVDGDGITPEATRLLVDGVDRTAESIVTDAGVTLNPTADLGLGQHNVVLEVQDAHGNPASVTWSFSVVQPDLSAQLGLVYWSSFDAYLNGELSVEISFQNDGSGDAALARVEEVLPGSGVTVLSVLPLDIGFVPSGGRQNITILLQISPGLGHFSFGLHGSWEDDGGNRSYR